MTAEDRAEVRTMLTDIIAGPLENINGKIRLMSNQLTNIEIQTTKTNGTVSRHEKLITENLPHNESHCTKTEDIEAIKLTLSKTDGIDVGKKDTEEKQRVEESIRNSKIRDNWYKVLTIIGLSCAIYFGFKNNKKIDVTETNIRKSIYEQEGVSKVTRGGYVKYNSGGISDSIKID